MDRKRAYDKATDLLIRLGCVDTEVDTEIGQEVVELFTYQAPDHVSWCVMACCMSMRCERCGTVHSLGGPVEVTEFKALGNAFMLLHAKCEE